MLKMLIHIINVLNYFKWNINIHYYLTYIYKVEYISCTREKCQYRAMHL